MLNIFQMFKFQISFKILKGFCTSGEEELQEGGPPWSSEHDLSKIEISRRVFGVIQNPSGFGVFRPMSTPGFKGFGSNFLIFEKSLFEFRIFLRNDHFD